MSTEGSVDHALYSGVLRALGNDRFLCVCGSNLAKSSLRNHLKTKKHLDQFNVENSILEEVFIRRGDGRYDCACGSVLGQASLKQHLETSEHLQYVMSLRTRGMREAEAARAAPRRQPTTEYRSRENKQTDMDRAIRNMTLQEGSDGRYVCACGSDLAKASLKRHLTTQKHLNWEMTFGARGMAKAEAAELKAARAAPRRQPTTEYRSRGNEQTDMDRAIRNMTLQEGSDGRYVCACGSDLAKASLKRHLTTQKHLNWVKTGASAKPVKSVTKGNLDVQNIQRGNDARGATAAIFSLEDRDESNETDVNRALRVGTFKKNSDNRYVCVCGSVLAKASLNRHLTTQKHLAMVKTGASAKPVKSVTKGNLDVQNIQRGNDARGATAAIFSLEDRDESNETDVNRALRVGTFKKNSDNRYVCVCGSVLAKASLNRHLTTQKHLAMVRPLQTSAFERRPDLEEQESDEESYSSSGGEELGIDEESYSSSGGEELGIDEEEEELGTPRRRGEYTTRRGTDETGSDPDDKSECSEDELENSERSEHSEGEGHDADNNGEEEYESQNTEEESISKAEGEEGEESESKEEDSNREEVHFPQHSEEEERKFKKDPHPECNEEVRPSNSRGEEGREAQNSSETDSDESSPPPERYSVRPKCGRVYIFNYETVQGKERREGAENDSANLDETFKDLGYQVSVMEDSNLSRRKTLMELKDIRDDPSLRDVDCLVLFFLSHGKGPNDFIAQDGNYLNLSKIVCMFTDAECPSLRGKPKVFFSNFCRTGNYKPRSEFPEKPKDIVTIHATGEGIAALRSPNHGTYFVSSLCDVLKKAARTESLREIFQELDKISMEKGGTQPVWQEFDFKEFYFCSADAQ